MSIIIGADIGGTLTKTVAVQDGKVIGMEKARTSGQVMPLCGAAGKLMHEHNLSPSDISEIYLTGAGSSFIENRVLGIKTCKVPEFEATAAGALRVSGLREALAVSMGTGTAFVRASDGSAEHIGGTGIGGGTVMGLASKMLGTDDIDEVLGLAERGNIRNVDLLVGDIANKKSGLLTLNMTASNFGKMKSRAREEDIALGIINMVFETIGMMVLFALRNDSISDVVLTGMLAALPQAKTIFGEFGKMSGKRFHIPENAQFATALGTLPAQG